MDPLLFTIACILSVRSSLPAKRDPNIIRLVDIVHHCNSIFVGVVQRNRIRKQGLGFVVGRYGY